MHLLTQTSAIIKGKPIPVEDLKGKEKYFQGDEVKQVDNLAKNNKPINVYWSVVMENFFRDDMTP